MPVRWGVLSTARIGKEQVIPAILRAENAELVAIASRDELVAKQFANLFRARKAYASYEELLCDKEIDAVYIPTPNHLHKEWTLKAARSGKHVLCEKPASPNCQDVKEMLDVCRESNVIFMEGFMYQFHPQWARVHELILQGEIGEIEFISASHSFFLENPNDIRFNTDGGGALYDVGCYCVHSILRILGNRQVQNIQAKAVFTGSGVDRATSALLKFDDGVVARIDTSFETFNQQYVQIFGKLGSITLSHAFRPDLGNPTITIKGKSGHRVEFPAQGDIYKWQIEHLSSCILEGEKPRNSELDSIRSAEMIDAIYKAVRESF